MKPEFTAHAVAPHNSVACATCHIVPGAAGWVQAKMSGTRQLVAVHVEQLSPAHRIRHGKQSSRLLGGNLRRLPCARSRDRDSPFASFTNSRTMKRIQSPDTVLMMNVGGGRTGGIHGAHMGPGVQMRYAASDKKRQTIPWVEYRNTESNVTRTYTASGAKPEGLAQFDMQCVDCHNRAAHSFENAERALDQAIAAGSISASLPFVKKTGLALLQAEYKSGDAGCPARSRTASALSTQPTTRPSRPRKNRRSTPRAKPSLPSTAAMCSPISRSPGERT